MPTPGKPVIKLENVSVVYNRGLDNEVVAIHDLSLEVFPGEYIVFFGQSGSGKSTLLYTIAGLENATTGTVVVDGHELHAISDEDMILYHRATIGMVFQAFYLIPHFSVLDNVCLPYMFEKMTKEERERRARILIERFGLTAVIDRTPSQMSGGQQQRTAIARALTNDPAIILADEPVGNLDSKNAEIVLDLLAKINQEEKRTIIQVTHNPKDIVYADRVFYMKDGVIERVEKNPNKKGSGSRRETTTAEALGTPAQETAHQKAMRLVEHLLHQYDAATEAKIESGIERFLAGDLSKDQLFAYLDGAKGANLNTQAAHRIAQAVSELGREMKDARQKPPHVSDIRGRLIARNRTHLTATQAKRLDEAIAQRIAGGLTSDTFRVRLDDALNRGGVGLNSRTAKAFADELDVILGNK